MEIMKINSIIIVGGGSSGWFTASSLNKHIPEINVTLIESPNIPTVGVGESTNLNINWFLHHSLGMKDEDWMPHCDATYKGTIKFTDFYKKGEFFHFPFGLQDLSYTNIENQSLGTDAWFFKKWLYPDTPQTDFAESYWPVMQMINKNKVHLNEDNVIPNFNIETDWAYQFDATKLAHYMKTNLCSNTKHISDHVTKVNLNGDGWISSLLTKEHGELKADLYIDCTGFNSMLLEKSLGVPHTSYEDTLINNGSWVTKLPYVDPNVEMEMTTNGTAIGNGWVWNIPLWNRISSGYVYSNKFIDQAYALEEFKEHLKRTNQWCKDNNPHELEYRHIDIRAGIHNKAWYKNCLAIGLSYGFVEPLESQGLVATIEGIRKLIIVLQTKDRHVTEFDRECVNLEIKGEIEDNKYFIIYHYIGSIRDDTEYWKWYTQELEFDWEITQNCFAYLSLCRFKHLTFTKTLPSLQCISIGHHINLYTDYTTKSQDGFMHYFNKCMSAGVEPIFEYWKERNKKISLLADKSPTHFEYLKEKIYKKKVVVEK